MTREFHRRGWADLSEHSCLGLHLGRQSSTGTDAGLRKLANLHLGPVVGAGHADQGGARRELGCAGRVADEHLHTRLGTHHVAHRSKVRASYTLHTCTKQYLYGVGGTWRVHHAYTRSLSLRLPGG